MARARLRFGRTPAAPSGPAPGAASASAARPARVAVLMGGPSRERAVSLRSGAAVAEALEARGFSVEWRILGREGVERSLAFLRADAAFIALHGTFGEDGACQRLLERLGIPYTGSGPEASALAFDKVEAKRRFAESFVSTPPWIEIDLPLPDGAALAERLAPLGFPAVVKPRAEGSSIGVTIVRGPEDCGRALAALEGRPALAEPFVPGRELTVAVLEDRALPVIEVVPGGEGGFYGYEAKYDPTAGTTYRVDPPLAAGEAEALGTLALRAHRALGCRGATRVDIRLDPERGPFVLEVNTIPGMTATSLLPKAARAAGIAFDALCARLVRAVLPGLAAESGVFAAAAARATRARRTRARSQRAPRASRAPRDAEPRGQ